MAIYIIEPTVNNLHRVIQDIENSVYDAFSIHFLYPPSHSIIDSLKTSIISPALQSKIFKIHVQNLNYIVLEENLFTLNSPSFVSLNLAHENSLLFDQIAMSLFSVLKTLKIKPIIKAGKGMSAKVGRKLAEMCWEDMEDAGGLTRPLLLLVDRDVDVSVMLHHP